MRVHTRTILYVRYALFTCIYFLHLAALVPSTLGECSHSIYLTGPTINPHLPTQAGFDFQPG